MCQLSYLQLPGLNSDQKKLLLGILLKYNAMSGHNDGFGVFSSHKIFKSGLAATNIANIYDLINFTDENPVVMAHVRKASIIVKEKIGEEFSHPFEYKMKNYPTLIGMHNGTLDHDKEKLPEDIIDSQFFFNSLWDNLLKDVSRKNNFPYIFRDTIKDFSGKFAFLIYYGGMRYIIRGKTADLHCLELTSEGNNLGFIINTEKNSLLNAVNMFSEYYVFNTKKTIEYEDPKIVPIETMYKISNKETPLAKEALEKIDVKFSETFPRTRGFWDRNNKKYLPVQTISKNINNVYEIEIPPDITHSDFRDKNLKVETVSSIGILKSFIEETGCGVYTLDILFNVLFGKALLNSTSEDFDILSKSVLPILKNKCSGKRRKRFIEQLWRLGGDEKRLYEDTDLEFPYFLTMTKEMETILNRYDFNRITQTIFKRDIIK